MQKISAIIIASIAWFAVITQYFLMLENKVTPIPEMTIRFFSFFTILTNLLVAIYFTASIFKLKNNDSIITTSPGRLTSITVYISIVGLVYQGLLRQVWQPTGLQKLVDELLHSAIPLLVIIYWYFFEKKGTVHYNQIPRWMLYPLAYLIFILIRGTFSKFYPYPFVDVENLGFSKVMLNSVMLIAVFIGVSAMFIAIGKTIEKGTTLTDN